MKVLVEHDGPVSTVVINRPETRNAIDPETASLLKAAFEQFEADRSQLAAVLCGTGPAFCSGYDLKYLSNQGDTPIYNPEGDGPLGVTRMLLSKPVVCAIEGHAVAGGLELALWCDVRIASETAVFGVFCRRWGVPLVDGGTVRLPRLIGQGRAIDMILTGRAVDAREAISFGLVNRVVPEGQARAEAERYAHVLTRFPQVCLRADRLSSYEQWGLSLESALRNEAHGGVEPLSVEAAEGASRFAEGEGRGGDFERI